jgi:Vitamin B6 photo-protection and homoeostasis
MMGSCIVRADNASFFPGTTMKAPRNGVWMLFLWILIFLSHHESTKLVVDALQQPYPPSGVTAATSNSASTEPLIPLTKVIVSTKKNGGHTMRYVMDGTTVSSSILLDSEAIATTPVDKTAAVPSPKYAHAIARRILDFLQTLYQTNAMQLRSKLRKEYWQQLVHRMQSGLRSTFLPIGYPHSVPPHYRSYVLWSGVQDLCTSIRSVLATQRVLQGLGVGQTTATALSAVQNFLWRDAAGMLATLSFTALAAAQFSKDVKRWRLFADCAVDVGITLEVLAVQLPRPLFVPVLCVANMCKAMCGVAAGATSGTIAVYWASRGTDISDICAKFGAQNTITGSLGLVVSALFAKSVATAPLSLVWILYAILTAVHIYANTQCMRILAFPQLNTVRFQHVVTAFFQQRYATPAAVSVMGETTKLPTPREVAKVEPLFFGPETIVPLLKRHVPIHFGVSFNEFMARSSRNPYHVAPTVEPSTPYWISLGSSSSSNITPENCCIVVAIPSNANAMVQTQAYFHASLYRRQIQECIASSADSDREFLHHVEHAVHTEFPLAWQSFAEECTQAGWDFSKTELHSQGYEITWPVE